MKELDKQIYVYGNYYLNEGRFNEEGFEIFNIDNNVKSLNKSRVLIDMSDELTTVVCYGLY